RLASDGFKIAINDLAAKSSVLKAVKKEIQESMGKNALIRVGYVSVEENVKTMIDGVVKTFGSLDVMSIVRSSVLGTTHTITFRCLQLANEWEWAFAINVSGTFLCYKW
ncbi:hypothetical protein GGU11DRAFT_654329, partial [Lentinula aff. detonsa]